jgi:hypothetical protein
MGNAFPSKLSTYVINVITNTAYAIVAKDYILQFLKLIVYFYHDIDNFDLKLHFLC